MKRPKPPGMSRSEFRKSKRGEKNVKKEERGGEDTASEGPQRLRKVEAKTPWAWVGNALQARRERLRPNSRPQ